MEEKERRKEQRRTKQTRKDKQKQQHATTVQAGQWR